MPELIRLYIRSVALGFVIAAIFVGGLIWLNIANLQHLVFNTSGGYLALFLLFFFNGLVFAGVQFGIAVMSLAEPQETDGGQAPRIPMADAFAPLPVQIEPEAAPRR